MLKQRGLLGLIGVFPALLMAEERLILLPVSGVADRDVADVYRTTLSEVLS